MSFKEIIEKEEILRVIDENGYTEPTEIQELIMPFIKEGHDVLGQSQTGTGKTLAFAASILDKIEDNKIIQSLILAPTRELAMQIAKEIEDLGKYTNISVTCVYGSSSIEDQIRKIKKGTEIVIGTPGRVKDLINRKVLKLNNAEFFVLDEADEMLSMGFKDDIEYIFEKTKENRQVLLFSATMPKEILSMAKKYMNKDYKFVCVKSDTITADHIEQHYYVTSDKNRLESMCRVLDYYNTKRAMIFCRTKRNADDVYERLQRRGYKSDLIHGDITQGQRIATLERFKKGDFNYLIATDVAARGIHVEDIELVINYNLPETNEAYVHRIGRTGRANKSGIAITFVTEREEKIIPSIQRHINTEIIKKELPTVEDIMPNRVNELLERIDCLKNNNSDLELFKSYLSNLSEEEMFNITSKLLSDKLKQTIGSDFNNDITIKEKTKKKKRSNNNANDDTIRVFMTIGKMDNVNKRDLLLFIEDKAKVKESTCSNVEIMTKFTFMSVKKDCYQKIFDSCNNAKYNGRVIKIEKAKK